MATVPDAPEKVKLVFKGKVSGYIVRRWVKGAGYEDFDTEETEGNTIVLPDDGESYIYEVTAEYKKGTVRYAFQAGK